MKIPFRVLGLFLSATMLGCLVPQPPSARPTLRLQKSGISLKDWPMVADILQKEPRDTTAVLTRKDVNRVLRLIRVVDFRIGLHIQNLQGVNAYAYKGLVFNYDVVKGRLPSVADRELLTRLGEAVSVNFDPGVLFDTSRNWDVGMGGATPTFIRLRSKTGNFVYQRLGRLFLDAERRLVNHSGLAVSPPIKVPPRAYPYIARIERTGEVRILQGDYVRATRIGFLKLYRFPRPAKLHSLGESLFQSTRLSGPPQPANIESARLLQGCVELSNVNFSLETIRLGELMQLREALVSGVKRLYPDLVFAGSAPRNARFPEWFRSLQSSADVIAGNIAMENSFGHRRLIAWRAPPGKRGPRTRYITDFRQGSLQTTNKKLDLAISGSGFFRLLLPDGTYAYTRHGAFNLDKYNQVVTTMGYTLAPPLKIPRGTRPDALRISSHGEVVVRSDPKKKPIIVGRILLYAFRNPEGLLRLRHGYFRETHGSGPPRIENPGKGGLGLIHQGLLEIANGSEVTRKIQLLKLAKEQAIACGLANRFYGAGGFSVCSSSPRDLRELRMEISELRREAREKPGNSLKVRNAAWPANRPSN